jgi:hypothetical protein
MGNKYGKGKRCSNRLIIQKPTIWVEAGLVV